MGNGLDKQAQDFIQGSLGIKAESRWVLEGSEGQSVSGEVVLAFGVSQGILTFKLPGKGSLNFMYGAGTVGVGVGLPVSWAVSTPANFTKGKLYLLDGFAGADLQPSDFEGYCMMIQLSVGAGVTPLNVKIGNGAPGNGGYITAMLIGISGNTGVGLQVGNFLGQNGLPGGIPPVVSRYLSGTALTAKAVLIMRGTETSTGGVSLTGGLGYLTRAQFFEPSPPKPVPPPPPRPPIPCTPGMIDCKKVKDDIYQVTIQDKVLFDFNKDNLRGDAEATLAELAKIIAANPGSQVLVVGYTDSVGWAPYNLGLSMRRAKSVQDWLLSKPSLKSSLKAGSVAIMGGGASNPVSRNKKPNGADDPEGRQRNRRVEITIYGPGAKKK